MVGVFDWTDYSCYIQVFVQVLLFALLIVAVVVSRLT